MGYGPYGAGMTPDVQPTTVRRMPGPVLAAAILLAGLGGITGLASAASGISDGKPVPAGMGAALLCAAAFGTYGITRRWRGAQIFAVVLGAGSTLGGFTGSTPGAAGQLVAGIALIVLVVIPVTSREWFTR